jgi:signal transduction histidine kinase
MSDAVAPALVHVGRAPDRRIPASIGYGAACLLAALAGGVAAAGAGPDAGEVALGRALVVGAPLAVGFYAWHSRRATRFGAVLMVLGLAWFLATFSESDRGGWYTLGRTAGWTAEVVFVYAALAYPSGRLTGRIDRLLVGVTAAVAAVFFVPQLFLAEQLQVPSPYTSCTADCPPSALFTLDTEPASLLDGLRSAGALLVFTIDLAVVARIGMRVGDTRSLTRRMLLPVAIVLAVRAALMGVAIIARQTGPDQQTLEIAVWALALATPALAVAFAVGLARFQLYAGRVLERLAGDVRASPDPIELSRSLARAFGDPQLRLAFPRPATPGLWSDSSGRPFVLPGPGSGRWVVEISDGGEVIAALVCDRDLELHPALVEAAASLVSVTLANQRLVAGAEASLRELEASRARLATSAERERRRIERDLHDGAQQRLVALRIELELAEELLGSDLDAGRARLRELEQDVDDALEELRAVAHGVYPPVLADRGLTDALRAVANRSPVRVDVEAQQVGRYPAELESAVYFCVLEALQNALKHANGVRRITVDLDGAAAAELRFAVRDDGAGVRRGDALRGGAGITGMRDRVAAFGGHLDIASAVGVGTTVRGLVRTDVEAAP